MSDWDINWVPQRVATYETEWKTLVTPFESGKEQRRQKWTRKKHKFRLSFDAVTDTVVDEIRVFHDGKYGSYTPFSYMNHMQRIKGTTLSLVDGGAGSDTVKDSAKGFIKKGFNTDLLLYVNGSANTSNNVFASLTVVTAGTLTVKTATWAAADSSNANLEVYCGYRVRFSDDSFENNFLYTDVAETKTVELVEVI